MKVLFIMVSLFLSLSAVGQVYQVIPGYGYIWERGVFNKSFQLPSDNTPPAGNIRVGSIRWNNEIDSVQVYDGDKWTTLGGGAAIDSANFYTRTQLQTAGQSAVNWQNITGKPSKPFEAGNGLVWSGPNKDTLTWGFRSYQEVDLSLSSFARNSAVFLLDTAQAHTFYMETRGTTEGGISSFVVDTTGVGLMGVMKPLYPEEKNVEGSLPLARISLGNSREGLGRMLVENYTGFNPGFGDISYHGFLFSDRYGLQLKLEPIDVVNGDPTYKRSPTIRLEPNADINIGFSDHVGIDRHFPVVPLLKLQTASNKINALAPLFVEKGFFSALKHTGDAAYQVTDSDFTIVLDEITGNRQLTLPPVTSDLHGRVVILQCNSISTTYKWQTNIPVYNRLLAINAIESSMIIQADGITGHWIVISQ